MRRAALALCAVALLARSVGAQSKPDFTGTWRLDPSRSESAMHGIPLGPVTVVIVQTADEIRLQTSTPAGTVHEVYRFTVGEAKTEKPTARWEGDTLILDVVRTVRGQSVTRRQARRLSADGQEMIVDSITNVQHGYSVSDAKVYGAGTDVVHARPAVRPRALTLRDNRQRAGRRRAPGAAVGSRRTLSRCRHR